LVHAYRAVAVIDDALTRAALLAATDEMACRFGESWATEHRQVHHVDQLLTTAEAAAQLGIKPKSAAQVIRRHGITKIGRQYRAGDILELAARIHGRAKKPQIA
jgi:hypothetical protein